MINDIRAELVLKDALLQATIDQEAENAKLSGLVEEQNAYIRGEALPLRHRLKMFAAKFKRKPKPLTTTTYDADDPRFAIGGTTIKGSDIAGDENQRAIALEVEKAIAARGEVRAATDGLEEKRPFLADSVMALSKKHRAERRRDLREAGLLGKTEEVAS